MGLVQWEVRELHVTSNLTMTNLFALTVREEVKEVKVQDVIAERSTLNGAKVESRPLGR